MQLTTEEEQYLAAVRASIDWSSAQGHRWLRSWRPRRRSDQVPADELAARLAGQVFDAMDTFHQEVSDAESPTSLQPQHQALLDAAATFVARENAYLDTVTATAPQEPVGVEEFFGIFFTAVESADLASPFDAFETACADLELAAYALGATNEICLINTAS